VGRLLGLDKWTLRPQQNNIRAEAPAPLAAASMVEKDNRAFEPSRQGLVFWVGVTFEPDVQNDVLGTMNVPCKPVFQQRGLHSMMWMI
jgi:hypothetical protein